MVELNMGILHLANDFLHTLDALWIIGIEVEVVDGGMLHHVRFGCGRKGIGRGTTTAH